MSTTSTVPTFRAALIAGTEAHATVTADGIQVADGWQGPDTEAEGIYLGEAEGECEPLAFKAGGSERMSRSETYQQSVIIQTDNPDGADNPQGQGSAVARAFALYGAVEEVLAANPQLGGVDFARAGSWRLETRPSGPGWAARLTAPVSCIATLT